MYTYMQTNIHFKSYLSGFLLEREMLQTNVVVEIKTHISCSVTFFRKSCRLWCNVENTEQSDRPIKTIMCIRIACCVPKSIHTHTHTHTEHVIVIAFPLQQLLHERASMLRYNTLPALLMNKFPFLCQIKKKIHITFACPCFWLLADILPS
jgi:hypothetical protein